MIIVVVQRSPVAENITRGETSIKKKLREKENMEEKLCLNRFSSFVSMYVLRISHQSDN